jgi:hypothetical protein
LENKGLDCNSDLVQAFGFVKGSEFFVGNKPMWKVMLWKWLLMFDENEFGFFLLKIVAL